jgi:hypothetical protein
MRTRFLLNVALGGALIAAPLSAFGQAGSGAGGVGPVGGNPVGGNVVAGERGSGNVVAGARGGTTLSGGVGGTPGGGAPAGGNIVAGDRGSGSVVAGARSGTNVNGGVGGNVGGGGPGATGGVVTRPNVPGGGAGTFAGGLRGIATGDGVEAGATAEGMRAGTYVDGLRTNIGANANVGSNVNVADRNGLGTGVGPLGVRLGPAGGAASAGWRYGGYRDGVYYPGNWWRNNRWYTSPADNPRRSYIGDGYPVSRNVGPQQVAARYEGPGATIRNPTEHTLNFMIDGNTKLSLAPGETKRLSEFPDYQLTFHRGGQLGTASYTVFEGNYDFLPSERGWELYRRNDNAAAGTLMNNEPTARTAERPLSVRTTATSPTPVTEPGQHPQSVEQLPSTPPPVPDLEYPIDD